MSKLRSSVTVSLDGFVAGPNQSVDDPLGVGGEQLHQWLLPLGAFRESHGEAGGEVNASTPVAEAILGGTGATIMGRNMFGGGARLFENLGDPVSELEQVDAIDAPGVTHIRFVVASRAT